MEEASKAIEADKELYQVARHSVASMAASSGAYKYLTIILITTYT